MADVSKISFVSGANVAPVPAYTPAAPAPRAQTSGAPVETAADDEQDGRVRGEKEGESQRVPAQRELDNVVSVSADGDTVQASSQALEQLEQDEELGGRVIAKPAGQETTAAQERIAEQNEEAEAAKEKRAERLAAEEEAKKAAAEKRAELREKEQNQKKAEEETGTTQQAIASYAGYSDAQLKQLYQNGTISKQDYDNEIAGRKDTREQQQSQNAAFAEEGSQSVARRDENRRDAQEMKNYERNDAANPLDVAERASILQGLQQQNQDPFANITTN